MKPTRLIFALLCSLVFSLGVPLEAAAPKPPNVLFIMTDEMRWNAMSCCEKDSVYDTPTLDRLASEGTRFTRAYTVAAICTASRYSFFTSRYAHLHGAVDNQTMLSAPQVFLQTIMKRHGYQTALSGKLHFLPQNQDYDFDYLWSFANEGSKKLETWPRYLERKQGKNARTTDAPFPGDPLGGDLARCTYPKEDSQSFWITDQAIDFFEIRDKSKPFFLFVSYLEPHSPSRLTEPYWSMYKKTQDAIELPATFVPEATEPSGNRVGLRQRGMVSDPAIARAMTAAYRAKIKHVDDSLARLFEGLRKAGLEDDTVIVFTADHGNMLGDHNLWFKGVPYEGSTRIPLIVKAPKDSKQAGTFNRGKTIDAVVESIDVMPTLMDILEKPLPADPGFQGKSLVNLVAGNDPKWKNIAFSERITQMVRTDRYKLCYDPRSNENEAYQLFDLKNDPLETKNLCDDPEHKAVFEDLKQKLVDWHKDTPPVPKFPGIEPAFDPSDKKSIEERDQKIQKKLRRGEKQNEK